MSDRLINLYDLVRAVGAQPRIYYGHHPRSRSRFNNSPWWFVVASGQVAYRVDHPGHYEDGSGQAFLGWSTFDEAVAAAERLGLHGPWRRAKGDAFGGSWWPQEANLPDDLRRDNGKLVEWIEGEPCRESTIGGDGRCQRPARAGDRLCGLHRGAANRRAANEQARQEAENERRDRETRAARMSSDLDDLWLAACEHAGIEPEQAGDVVVSSRQWSARVDAEVLGRFLRYSLQRFEAEG